jgi:hypothetical protein
MRLAFGITNKNGAGTQNAQKRPLARATQKPQKTASGDPPPLATSRNLKGQRPREASASRAAVPLKRPRCRGASRWGAFCVFCVGAKRRFCAFCVPAPFMQESGL